MCVPMLCDARPGKVATMSLHHTPHHSSWEKLETPLKAIFHILKLSNDHIPTEAHQILFLNEEVWVCS